jgi:hypothetical protein
MSNVLKRGQFLSLDLSQNPLGDSGAFAHEFRFSAVKYFGVPQSAAECRRAFRSGTDLQCPKRTLFRFVSRKTYGAVGRRMRHCAQSLEGMLAPTAVVNGLKRFLSAPIRCSLH